MQQNTDLFRDSEKTLKDYLDILRRRKLAMILTVTVLLGVSLAVALLLPPIYQSTATILIEQQAIPADLVRTTVTSYADERIQIISKQVMTSANLRTIIDKYNLYAEEREEQLIETIVKRLESDIELEMISADVVDPKSGKPKKASVAFSLTYSNRSPELAQKVANELVSLYLKENIRQRTEATKGTSIFLQREARRLKATISQLESKLANFKERNMGRLPELFQLNMELLNKIGREMTEVDRQIQNLNERRVYLESELAHIEPEGPLYSETGVRLLSPAGRLKALEAELASATARYSADHPDVVRLRKEIDALKMLTGVTDPRQEIATKLSALKTQLSAARQRYSSAHPDVKRLVRSVTELEKQLERTPAAKPRPSFVAQPTNPAYIQLQTRLKVADAELVSLQARAKKLQEKHALYEKRLTETPQVEREYKELTHDYETAKKKYNDIVAKQMEAKVAQSLESEQKGERFTLLEPPALPTTPAEPNRKAIALLGFVFSLVGGIGAVALAETLDTRVYGREGVTEVLGVPPLAAIPHIKKKPKRRRLAAVGA